MRQPIFNNKLNESSDYKRDMNYPNRQIQEFSMVPCPESFEANYNIHNVNLNSNRGSQVHDGTISGLVDMTFQRTSMNMQPHAMSTPATVEDLIQLDKSRPSN